MHPHLAVHRHVVLPLGRIISGEVVGLAGLEILAGRLLRALRSEQAHPHHGRADAGLQFPGVGGPRLAGVILFICSTASFPARKSVYSGPARQPLHIDGGLAAIWLKTQRQLAVVDHCLG